MNPSSTPRAEFIRGMRDTIPLIVGAIPFGIIFGAIAISNGLSPAAVLGMSLFVFAGSSQFIAAGLVGQGTGIVIIVVTTFIVNLRHALYSATLAPHYKHLSQRWLLPLAFWLTDETFAIVAARFDKNEDTTSIHWYQLGSSIAMYVNWFTCTVIGVIAGQMISQQQAVELGFQFAMSVTFIGIVIPLLKTRPMLLAAFVAGVVAVVTNPLPNKVGLIIAALTGVAAGMIGEALFGKAEAAPAKEFTDSVMSNEG